LDQFRLGLSEREEKQLRALRLRKNRRQEGHFLAEGIRVVEALLESTIVTDWAIVASSLEDTERGAALQLELEKLAIPRRVVPREQFLRLAPTEQSQGILAVARIPEVSWDSIAEREDPAVLLLLDAIQDPGNFGTLVRTAEALGAVAIVALPGTVDPWNEKAVRAAAGSSFYLPILTSTWDEAAAWMAKEGYRVLAADVGGDPPERGEGRIGLVMGNEGAGISAEIRSMVDKTVGIPLKGRAESLNVAAAAAILLYELTR
jgi:TrmH family RNA methyltransferase